MAAPIELAGYWAIGVTLGFATPPGPVGVWIGLAAKLAVVALFMARWLRRERRNFSSRAESGESRAAEVAQGQSVRVVG